MPGQHDILAVYDTVGDYAEVGRRFSIHPGQAYLIATGLPADGGDNFANRVRLSVACRVGAEERRSWGAKFRRAVGPAPTHPHPGAPKRPEAAAKAAGAVAAAQDKVRDALGDRPADRRGKAGQDVDQQEESG